VFSLSRIRSGCRIGHCELVGARGLFFLDDRRESGYFPAVDWSNADVEPSIPLFEPYADGLIF